MKHNVTSGRPPVFAAAILAMALSTHAKAGPFATDTFKLYGDFRTRVEADWDSHLPNGEDKRDDRGRVRVRARVGFQYDPFDRLSFGIRLRSGSDDSQQSPHMTVVDFDGKDTGDADFNLDKWFLKGKHAGAWGWVGRNSLPIWKQNELFWDDDVTPAGIGAGYQADVSNAGTVAINAGYFTLPVGMRDFDGNLAMGQLVFSGRVRGVELTLAGGVFAIDEDFDAAKSDDPAGRLLNGNGTRDYTLWVGNLRAGFNAAGWPLTVGMDYMHNSEDYSAAEVAPFPAGEAGEKDGFVLSARIGQSKTSGDWLAAYYYARIETFAVNSSYAQDDWVRWGSATETTASNMKGHEFRLVYVFAKNINVVARLYLVESITTKEDGNRFRTDLNFEF